MRIYVVERGDEAVRCDVHSTNGTGEYVALHPLRHVALHSPTGFETGYAGSGPSDLALSILTDFFAEEIRSAKQGFDSEALRLHQDFKFKFIAPRQLEIGSQYSITEEEISKWVAAQPERD